LSFRHRAEKKTVIVRVRRPVIVFAGDDLERYSVRESVASERSVPAVPARVTARRHGHQSQLPAPIPRVAVVLRRSRLLKPFMKANTAVRRSTASHAARFTLERVRKADAEG
jgi:hypothetical protein